MEQVNGVYAIEGPNGIYVGESDHCWKRGTLELAHRLGWPCGIVRELPRLADRMTRLREEREVALLFQSRGLKVVSWFLPW